MSPLLFCLAFAHSEHCSAYFCVFLHTNKWYLMLLSACVCKVLLAVGELWEQALHDGENQR